MGNTKQEKLHVVIVSPERTLYSDNAESVIVPGTKGSFEVLKDHAPIISSLQKGDIVVKGERQQTFSVSGGFIEVCNNEVSLCIETN